MIKRLFDILSSLFAIIILLPFFLLIAFVIVITSGFPIFYFQERVGKKQKPFKLIKFRTMKNNADQLGLITVGEKDSRITNIGYFLRKYKLDELPQLFNVLLGTMSIVGPRPEVKKYVDLYSKEQLKVLNVKPGISDYASIYYSNENEVLAKYDNPDKAYIDIIMPNKLKMNLQYIKESTFLLDLKIIFRTLLKIIS